MLSFTFLTSHYLINKETEQVLVLVQSCLRNGAGFYLVKII